MSDESTARAEPVRAPRLGLSGKLLVFTILFVMIAEVLIYVPSIALYRLMWLNDRLAAAITLALFATGVAASVLLIAAHDRPFTGETSVRPDPLLQVMPLVEAR